MKKLLLTTLLLTTTTAFAGSLNFDLRVDSESKTYNAEQNKINYSRFRAHTVRLDYKGKVDDETDVRLRFKLIPSSTALTANDSTNTGLDFAYATRKINDNFSFSVGKVGNMIGGIEQQAGGTDTYLYSAAGANYATKLYSTGFNFQYKMDVHQFNLIATNRLTDMGTTAAPEEGRMLTGLVYQGSFMDKMVNPFFGYHTESYSDHATSPKENKYTDMAIGAKFVFGDIGVDAEMLTHSNNNSSDNTKMDTHSSTVLAANYKMDNYKFIVKSASTATKTADVDGTKYARTGFAFEYKPVLESNFRYHVAMNTLTDTPVSGTASTTSEFLVGMRLSADFLK